MMLPSIAKLLKKNNSELMKQRRAADRKPFACPVRIEAGKNRDDVHEAFSRDISPIGIGILSRVDWPVGAQAVLTVQPESLKDRLCVLAEARWTKPFGDGWYATGWKFLCER